jgi:predicted nucleic acid-binding protein
MRVLFDTNVVLEVLLARPPHAAPAIDLFDRVARRELDGLLSATIITTIFYLAAKVAGPAQARRHVTTLLSLFEVAAVGRAALADALTLGLGDNEDAVLHEAAHHAGATGIVTRDPRGFAAAKLTIYSPAELLRILQATQ